MKLAFHIAKRFLLSAKSQTFVIILGIAIGVSVQVFIGSLISGLQASLVDSTIGSSSQITVTVPDSYVTNYNSVIDTVMNANDNVTVATPTINTSGSLVNGSNSEIIVLRGFDFSTANKIYKLDQKITEGALPANNNEIVLGGNLKDLLDINVGDSVKFSSPVLTDQTYKVVGFFNFNVKQINDTWVIANLATIQNLLGINSNQVTQVEMQLNKVFDADVTAAAINTALNDNTFQVSTWIEQNAELLSGLQGQSISSLMIQIFVIVSVVLGISSVLAISVLQKSRQLGILKAMGIKDKDASKIFLFEGLILGIFGALLGVVIGLGLSYMFATFAIKPDGNPVVPLTIDTDFIIISGLIAITASAIASLSPAIKSSKLSVIEVIRNG